MLLLISCNYVMSQASSTAANIGIDAKVIAPISLSNTGSVNMDFGTITRSSISGTVTISADGERTSTGGASTLSSSLFSAAPFTVSGESNSNFTIALPVSDVILTKDGGTQTMEVNFFTHNSDLVLSELGGASFSVGATLNLDADQASGDYQGSFSVTINYQ